MERIEDVNQALRDENQKLTLANENKNTTIDALQRKILVMEDQLKKRLLTAFTVWPQRNPKFPDPEQFGGARDEFEPFKLNFRTKLQTNGDWYFTEERKFNYAFSRFKNLAQSQIFLKMNPNNVLKVDTVEKLLQCWTSVSVTTTKNKRFKTKSMLLNKGIFFSTNTWSSSGNI